MLFLARVFSFVSCALLALVSTRCASAQPTETREWLGGSGEFHDPAKWTGPAPSFEDEASFPWRVASGTVAFDYGAETNLLRIERGFTFDFAHVDEYTVGPGLRWLMWPEGGWFQLQEYPVQIQVGSTLTLIRGTLRAFASDPVPVITGGSLDLRAGASLRANGDVWLHGLSLSEGSEAVVAGYESYWTGNPLDVFARIALSQSQLTVNGNLRLYTVKKDGTSVVIQDGGKLLTGGWSIIDPGTPNAGQESTARVLISGTNSTWESKGDLYLGGWSLPDRVSHTAVEINEGGKVFNWGILFLACQNPVHDTLSVAEIEVRGNTSSWYNVKQAQIGNSGVGTLRVLEGAKFSNTRTGSSTLSSGILGVLQGSLGTALVSGQGSHWDNQDGFLVAGFSGEGQLTVSDSGLVESTGGFVGRNPGSVGSVYITGIGSEWRSRFGNINVGLGPGGAAGGTGILTVADGGKVVTPTLTIGSTGTLAGDGRVIGAVVNRGVVSPGESAGVLTIEGNFTQLQGGSLLIEIGGPTPGTQYDVLSVTGPASLNGILDVRILSGFQPDPANVFAIITAGSRNGVFSKVVVSGGTLDVDYSSGAVRLTNVVPEPSSLALLSIAVFGAFCLWRRQRREV